MNAWERYLVAVIKYFIGKIHSSLDHIENNEMLKDTEKLIKYLERYIKKYENYSDKR